MLGKTGAFQSLVTPNQIHTEIERLSEDRQELWHSLRLEKARLRFGERDEIVRRARAEERLERAA